MTQSRFFMLSTMVTGVIAAAALADPPAPEAGSFDLTLGKNLQVLRLEHAHAPAVAHALKELSAEGGILAGFHASAVNDTTLIVRAREEMMGAVRSVVEELDKPATSLSSDSTTAFLPLGSVSTATLGPVIDTILSKPREQFALDPLNHRLVVRASPASVARVAAFLKEADASPSPLQLEFHFLRGSLSGNARGDAPNLPKSLQSVASALREGGWNAIEDLAPIIITSGGEGGFSSSSAINRKTTDGTSEVLEFAVKGTARPLPETEFAQMEIRGQVFGEFGPDEEKPEGRTQFDVNTTLTLKLGEYVVLAAAPSTTSAGDAIALAVRVTMK